MFENREVNLSLCKSIYAVRKCFIRSISPCRKDPITYMISMCAGKLHSISIIYYIITAFLFFESAKCMIISELKRPDEVAEL